MSRVLELAPYSPFCELEKVVANLRRQHPGISELGISQAIKRMLGVTGSWHPERAGHMGGDHQLQGRQQGYNPRHPGRVVHLFGTDIMTADVTSIPAWPHISDGEQRRILAHPVQGGTVLPETLDGDDDPKRRVLAQMELANRLDRHNVNRSALISPRGLSQTYVWRLATNWVQEVADADYDLILSVAGMRRLFRDPDVYGPYQDVRSYEAPGIVTTREETTSAGDVAYLLQQMQRQPSWQGTDLPHE